MEFTEKELKEIVEALRDSYEAVAQDLGETGYISRDEVWELAADASRPVMFGDLDTELYNRMIESDRKTKDEIKMRAFPHKHYEVG